MTGNKDFLTDYQELDGGFVAFGGSTRRGPQEANGDTGLKKSVDARQSEEKNVSTQQYIVFPLWSSISLSYKSSDETYKNDTADDAAGKTPVQKPASENKQALKNVLDKMMDQEKEASEQSDAVRKEFEAQCNRELLQGKATKASNFSSWWDPIPLNVNDLPNDPLMPDLEDTAEVQNTSIFGSAFDDEDLDTYNSPFVDQVMGAEADFQQQMEPSSWFTSQSENSMDHSLVRQYVGEILKKFGFSSIRTASTPMETNKALTKDEDGEDVDVHLYRSMIGSLMYLTSSRLDIMFFVCACSRFQVQPKVSHLNAVKRIFRYLKGRPNLGLWYPKDSPFILEAFSDSDYAGASLDRKSTTEVVNFLVQKVNS
ncbi:hypothetical protein Tco_0740787 [Tanacetum coccineum]